MLGDGLGLLLGGVVDGAGLAQRVEQPPAGHLGVGDGLERGEGLGDDDHERGLGVEALDLLGDVVGVDVGDEAHRRAVQVGAQALVHHDRAEVGAADADGDDVLDGLAGDALPLARADAVGEGIHLVQDLVDVSHDILAVDDERASLSGRTAQRGVQDGAILGGVDVVATIHGGTTLLKTHGAAEVSKQLDGLVGDEVLGEVEVQVGRIKGELLDAVGISREPILQADALGLQGVKVVLECLPLGGLGDINRCGNLRHIRLLSFGCCAFGTCMV